MEFRMTTTFLAQGTAGWKVVPFPEMGIDGRRVRRGLGKGRSKLEEHVNSEIPVMHPSVLGAVRQLDI